jgi:hypothetical protein
MDRLVGYPGQGPGLTRTTGHALVRCGGYTRRSLLAGKFIDGRMQTTHRCQTVGIVWHDSGTGMIGPLLLQMMAHAMASNRITDLRKLHSVFFFCTCGAPLLSQRPAFECPIKAVEESSEAGPLRSGRGSGESGHRGPQVKKRGFG